MELAVRMAPSGRALNPQVLGSKPRGTPSSSDWITLHRVAGARHGNGRWRRRPSRILLGVVVCGSLVACSGSSPTTQPITSGSDSIAPAGTASIGSAIQIGGSEQVQIGPAADTPSLPAEVRSLTSGPVNLHLESNQQPSAPVLVSYKFDPASLRDGESAVILHFDETTHAWRPEITFVSSDHTEAFAYVTHLSGFDLVAWAGFLTGNRVLSGPDGVRPEAVVGRGSCVQRHVTRCAARLHVD